jgi:hypothetical protein
MAWYPRLAIAAALLLAGWAPACSRCGEEPPSTEQPGSTPLPFEQLALEASPDVFRAAVARLAGLTDEEAARLVPCGEQSTLTVIDPGEETAEERAAGAHRLSNCALQQAGAGRSWDVAAIRGEFVDDALASVTISYAANAHDRLLGQLTERFGQPAREMLSERSLLGDDSREYAVWRLRDELWALTRGRQNAMLIHQHLARCAALPPLPEPSARPKPVDLDDLGLGGGLDLKAPLPAIDAGLLVGGDR